MDTLLSQGLRPEPFPNADGKFIDCWKSGNQGNTRTGVKSSEIKLFACALIWNRSYPAGNTRPTLYRAKCFRFVCCQKGFGERVRHKGSRSRFRAQISFCVELRKCEANC